ncbi:MAG: PD40 domain-containing protein [Bacteroidales bacterium]|nr:PD40 domain-containing protein [Bacteroidales bacterium]MBN2764119.1 PD40 domain-containing protein [Bacteroidales bacterium]
MRIIVFVFSFSLLLSSCWERHKYETGHFTESVVNFSDANSEFDDYNSTAPYIYYDQLFHFSSNRKSYGIDYDIVGEKMYIDWSKTKGTLSIGTDLEDDRFDYLMPMFDSVNTPCNELGPYSLGYRKELSNTEVIWTDIIMYASDCEGDFDLKFICSQMLNTTTNTSVSIGSPCEIGLINNEANELYPSFYGTDFYSTDVWGIDPGKIEKLLYCSDKNGNFDIYEIDLPSGDDIADILSYEILIEPALLAVSSGSDDKCPFANGKLLVFASNRPGGYGGFDLYYSRRENGSWSAPVNFGDHINTEFDEYRPIALYFNEFDNNLMIFSSNRPGGKGGFDLYYTGIKQMIR